MFFFLRERKKDGEKKRRKKTRESPYRNQSISTFWNFLLFLIHYDLFQYNNREQNIFLSFLNFFEIPTLTPHFHVLIEASI